jgi:DNA-directed RNA polymerase specialized sigma24 family protein
MNGSTSGRSCPGRRRTTDVSVLDEPPRPLDYGALSGFGRDLIPRVLAGLVRRGEKFDAAEDALQEALLEALRVWPEHPPRDPTAWLTTVAIRRLVDARRRAATVVAPLRAPPGAACARAQRSFQPAPVAAYSSTRACISAFRSSIGSSRS